MANRSETPRGLALLLALSLVLAGCSDGGASDDVQRGDGTPGGGRSGAGMPSSSGAGAHAPTDAEATADDGEDDDDERVGVGRAIDFVDPSSFNGELNKDSASRLYPNINVQDRVRHEYDPDLGVRLMPDVSVSYKWNHPRFEIVLESNNMGFREDEDTEIEHDGYRIFSMGDSHAEGFLYNEESYANVLEGKLNRMDDGRSYDVINAGIGGVGPWYWPRQLRKHADLKPDMAIVGFFTGNDFYNALHLLRFEQVVKRKNFPEGYGERLNKVRELIDDPPRRWGSASLGNGLNQAYRFMHWPEEEDESLEAALHYIDELIATCEELDVELVFLLIPIKPDVDLLDDQPVLQTALDTLGMTREQAAVGRRLGLRLAEALESRGLTVIDPTEEMRSKDIALYWRKDYHLNVWGHNTLATILFRELRAQIRADR